MSDPSTDRATAETASPTAVGGRGPKGRRRRIFRLLAIGVGLLPLAVAELVLAAIGLGGPGREVDPFVGFSELRPLFVLDREGTRFEIPAAHYKFFRPESFGARRSRASSGSSASAARPSRGGPSRSRRRSRPGSNSA